MATDQDQLAEEPIEDETDEDELVEEERIDHDDEEEQEHSSQVFQRGIVLDRFKTFFVPVPKAGCTSILWSLAGLAGLQESNFATSEGREVTRALAIHDLRRWPDAFLLGERSEEDQKRILSEDGWFRFTVVRDPFRRVWSAWQSKILLAEPQFIEKFSSEPWFPRQLESAKDVLTSWRDFLDALRKDPELVNADVHWQPQVDVLEYNDISYDHIGRVEKMPETIDLYRRHVKETADRDVPDLIRTNLSTMPYTNALFTQDDVQMLSELYAADLREFGYEPPKGGGIGDEPSKDWIVTIDAVVPAIDELRSRHERVADLQQAVKTRRQSLRESDKNLKREKALRRGEHRRNKRLKKRLAEESRELRRMRQSRAWKMTAPIRAVGAWWRGVKKSRKGAN